MKINNPIINKYLLNGKYNVQKSEERKKEIWNINQVQHFPIKTRMENGENIFYIGNKIKF